MWYTRHVQCWKWNIEIVCDILERRADTNNEKFSEYKNAVLNVEGYLNIVALSILLEVLKMLNILGYLKYCGT